MTHIFKKFTPLFLAGILCLSAAPAHSAESWSSFALKGVGAYAAYLGIGLGSTIAHEYGHAIAAEMVLPGSVNHIAIGSSFLPVLLDIQLARPFLNPIVFPEGLGIAHALGLFGGHVYSYKIGMSRLQEIAISAAGPLAGAAFSLSTLGLIHYFTKRRAPALTWINRIISGHALGNLAQLISLPGVGTDGEEIQQNLGISALLYNTIAIPAVCYAGYKITQWNKKLSDPEKLD